MDNHKLEVKTNKTGQKILLINNIFAVEHLDKYEYDIILMLSTEKDYVFKLLRDIRTVIDKSGNLFIKPIFISPALKGHYSYNQLADGYASDVEDLDLVVKSVLIQERINQLKSDNINLNVYNARNLLMQILRFYFTRGDQLPHPELKYAATFGYSFAMFELFYKYKLLEPIDTIKFLKEFQDNKYIETNAFIAKIHLCPKCYHSHLLFTEVCPQCGSSNIETSSVIHHFPCANVAPEGEYKDGELLRCPKCKKLLRHIGVDYDRPSEIYTCNSCHMSFMQPKMKVLCTKCGVDSAPEHLYSFDMHDINITELGKKILIEGDVDQVERESIQFKGLVSYKNLLEQVNSHIEFLNISQVSTNKKPLFITRVSLLNSYLNFNTVGVARNKVSLSLCETFTGHTISFYKNKFYICVTDMTEDELNKEIAQLSNEVKRIISSTTHTDADADADIDYIKYEAGDNREQFVRNMNSF